MVYNETIFKKFGFFKSGLFFRSLLSSCSSCFAIIDPTYDFHAGKIIVIRNFIETSIKHKHEGGK